MKNLFFYLSAAVMLFAVSCSKDASSSGANGEVDVRFNVSTPETHFTNPTRALGEGSQVNRYILEVYLNGELYSRADKDVAAGTKEVSFDMRLVASKTYDLVFWADCSKDNGDNHYDTSGGLTKIAFKGDYLGGDDTRDAFYNKTTITVNGAFSQSITLKRPFGQLNVKTTDLADILLESLKPDQAFVSFTEVYTSFNALTGEPGTPAPLSYSANVNTVDNQGYLTMDYLLASPTEDKLVDYTVNLFNAGIEILSNDGFTNIPIRMNYRTNVSGNLLTKKGTLNVTLDPVFDNPDIEKEIVEVETIDEIKQALEAGATHVVVSKAVTTDKIIELPKIYDSSDVKIAITLPSTSNKVTVTYDGELKNAPGTLYFNSAEVSEIDINTPDTSVILNGVSYNTVNATTADNTLTVGSDVSIYSLTLNKGNAVIYGTVSNLYKGQGYTGTIMRGIASSADMLRAAVDKTTGYSRLIVERQAIGVDGSGSQFDKPMIIAADADLKNFSITAPAGSSGITIAAKNINVILKGVSITQPASKNGIQLEDSQNVNLKVTDSFIILGDKANNQMGVYATRSKDCKLYIDGTHIGPQKEVIAEPEQDYTPEQVTAFSKRSNSRGIAVANSYNMIADIRNTHVDGLFYAFYTQSTQGLTINIDNSVLDGRAALEIGNTGRKLEDEESLKTVYNITNSKLAGRNSFAGPMEDYATIVFYNVDTRIAENNMVYVSGSEIHCYNNPQTETNWQYVAQMRPARYNLLSLTGVKIVDHSNRLEYAVDIQDDSNKIFYNNCTFEGNGSLTMVPGK